MTLAVDPARLEAARRLLLLEIADEAMATRRWTGRGRFSERVMAAMAKVPRERFVLPADLPIAYINRPLSIGHGQTISQPYIVALMTDLLDLLKSDRVLEIGTGCGYQTAVLAEVAGRVYSVEVIPELAAAAGRRLKEIGYGNVELRTGDGFLGWPDKAPFDAVIVTAAPESIPESLVAQLNPRGRLVIPVGRRQGAQMLLVGEKTLDGRLVTRDALPVAFVPMVRGTLPEERDYNEKINSS